MVKVLGKESASWIPRKLFSWHLGFLAGVWFRRKFSLSGILNFFPSFGSSKNIKEYGPVFASRPVVDLDGLDCLVGSILIVISRVLECLL